METIVTHQYQASHSNTTRRVIVSAVASALATLMAGNAAMAQTADAAATAAPAATADNAQAARSPSDVAPTNVVTVVGTRKSVASAIDRKIRNATISDSLVAEDINQFPDKNVGEALSRITGVQLTRDFGEGSQISIRGVEPDLNRVEVNGMSVLGTNGNAGRGAELRELASELIGSIDVYKGSTADLTEGGVGGTVVITTRKPLDFKKFTVASSLAAEHSTSRGGVQPRGSLLIADQYLDGKLGVMANIVYDDVRTRNDYSRNTTWRFLRDWDFSPEKTVTSMNSAAAGVGTKAGCAALTVAADRTECERQWFDYSPSVPRYVIGTRSHERKSGEFTAQYKFSDSFNAFASYQRNKQDARYQDFTYGTDFADVNRLATAGRAPVYGANGTVTTAGTCNAAPTTSTPAGMVVTNHHVTEYVVGDCLSLSGRGGSNAFSIEARDFVQRVDNYYRTAGLTWRRDGWDIDAMLTSADGRYRNDSNYLGLLMNAPGLQVNLDSRGFPHFTFPANGGPDNLSAYTQVQFTYNPVEIDNSEDQLRLDFRYRPQWPLFDRVAFGVQGRRQATQRYANGGYILDAGSDLAGAGDDLAVQSPNVRYTWNYDPLNPTGALRPPVVQSFVDANNEERWVTGAQMRALVGAVRGASPDFLAGAGLDGFPSNWASASYGAAAPFFDTSGFTHDRVRQAPGSDGAIHAQIPTYHVEERTRAAYARVDYSTAWFGHALEGNLGLRYAGTRTRSLGRQRLFVRTERAAGSATYDDRLLGTAIVARENRYHDFLPSANAVLWLRPETLLLRAGYGKVMARPSLERLSPNITCVINSGKPQFGGDGVDKCTAGNPGLQPYRATSTDLSLEWYPGQGNQVSLAYFRKDIDTAIRTGAVVRTDLLQDGTLFDVTTTVNTRGATTKGIEFAVRTALSFLPAPFDGFGVQGSYTHTEVKADYTAGSRTIKDQLIGLSKNSFNLVGFYDKGPLSARLSYVWRDKYLSSTGSTVQAPTYVAAFGSLDGQLSVRAADNLTLSLEGINIADAHQDTYNDSKMRFGEINYYGRTILFGIRAEF